MPTNTDELQILLDYGNTWHYTRFYQPQKHSDMKKHHIQVLFEDKTKNKVVEDYFSKAISFIRLQYHNPIALRIDHEILLLWEINTIHQYEKLLYSDAQFIEGLQIKALYRNNTEIFANDEIIEIGWLWYSNPSDPNKLILNDDDVLISSPYDKYKFKKINL